MAKRPTGRLVLATSAVERIIEGAEQAANFQEAVLSADLVLALTCHLDHPVDDCLYLALARREAAAAAGSQGAPLTS
jgi:hypothetical protein